MTAVVLQRAATSGARTLVAHEILLMLSYGEDRTVRVLGEALTLALLAPATGAGVSWWPMWSVPM